MGNRGSKDVKRPEATRVQQGSSPREAPLGEWQSPITSASITEKAVKLSGPTLRPSDGALLWLEIRPNESGRQVLVMRSPDGSIRDVTPPVAPNGFNVRCTVHEYGGGDYCVVDDTVYFSNFSDQALYAQDLAGAEPSEPRLVTHGSEARGERFADASWDSARRRLVAISEIHRDDAGAELAPEKVISRLVAIDVATGAITPLATGADFYAYPRPSPCGRWLAWIQWDFPNMPWDHTALHVAPLLDDGTVGQATRVAGLPGAVESSAVQQPVWSADGTHLYYVDDKSGWWNLYRCRTPGTAEGWAQAEAEALCPMEAEWGFPTWSLGCQSYKALADGSVVALFCDPKEAGTILALLQPPTENGESWRLTRINAGLTNFGTPALAVRQLADGRVTLAAVGASHSRGAAVVQLTAASPEALAAVSLASWEVVKMASSTKIPDGYVSIPEAVSYPSTFDGKPATAHMLYYPPTNKDFKHPRGTLPPLLVKSHGGPTSAAVSSLSPVMQYWTSRGFAVADINYGGSTGYGTAYRNRLNGRWGVVDVEDCCAAAEWLVAAGRVDRNRLCIAGGSAGGYTTLACLAFRKTFSAGASHYGVADLRLLAEHTHKFESRYLDVLVGPLPEAADVYQARSPLQHPEGFSSPVIFFQGDQDKVVPPEQAVAMYDAIKAAGLPTGLIMMAGEQHGFRQAVNIRTALEGELFFYGAVLGFPATMSEGLLEIKIDNLPTPKAT